MQVKEVINVFTDTEPSQLISIWSSNTAQIRIKKLSTDVDFGKRSYGVMATQ